MPPLHSLRRTFSSSATTASTSAVGFKLARDRGLDHAVEREKNLIPLINTKNLINSEPSKSLPISAIADRRAALRLPGRPIEFLRRYPSVFREFLPAGPAALVRPHFALTAESLDLHADEQLMYRSDSYRRDAAARVLRLLMLCRSNRLPLAAVDRLRWDLGLPEDFDRSLIPEFPDYFRVAQSSDGTKFLELVCWIDEFGVSALEKKVKSHGGGDWKCGEIRFPTQYSRGFEMDKKYKKWVENWQKLNYFSPYENCGHLPAKSDESDRWAAAVLHEFLHILVPKKTMKENALSLGECLGLRAGFKRVMFQLPGIFYLSSKNDTHTLVLKEGYKRGVLVEEHPLMSMRSKYIHLMNSAREESKAAVSVPAGGGNAKRKKKESSEANAESEEVHEVEVSDSSEDEGVGGEDERRRGGAKGERSDGRRRASGTGLEVRRRAGNPERRRSDGRHSGKSGERVVRKFSLGTEKRDRRFIGQSSVAKRKGSSVRDEAPS